MKLTVNNMTCNHCVMTIQKALLINNIKGDIDLATKSVEIKKESDVEKAKEVIKKAGYEVSL